LILTYIRLITIVNTCVCVERTRAIERLAASLTLVRFVRCVDDLVSAQSRCLTKAFAANLLTRFTFNSILSSDKQRAYLAHKGTSTSMNGHVSRQIVMRVEDLPAFGTSKSLGLCIRC